MPADIAWTCLDRGPEALIANQRLHRVSLEGQAAQVPGLEPALHGAHVVDIVPVVEDAQLQGRKAIIAGLHAGKTPNCKPSGLLYSLWRSTDMPRAFLVRGLPALASGEISFV